MKFKNFYFISLFLYIVLLCSCVNRNNIKAVGTVSMDILKHNIIDVGGNFVGRVSVSEKLSENKQDGRTNNFVLDGTNGSTPPNVIHVERNNNTVTTPVNLGKVQVNETKKFDTVYGFNAKSITTNSKDIVLKETIDSANRTVLHIEITKTKPGFFSDTVRVVSETIELLTVYSGEAISD